MPNRYIIEFMSKHPSSKAPSTRKYPYGVWDTHKEQWVLRSEFVSFSRAKKIRDALEK